MEQGDAGTWNTDGRDVLTPRCRNIREYLNSGEEMKARDLVLKCRSIPLKDAMSCCELAELCEELGMARQAREYYEKALRWSPDDSEILYRLACLLADVGHYEESMSRLKKAIKRNPDHEGSRRLLAQNYRAMGLCGLAETLAPEEPKPHAASGPRFFPPSIGRRDRERFLNLFSGREVGYGLQEVDPKVGDIVLIYHHGIVTSDLVRSHLAGEITLAVYPLRSDNTVRFAGISVRLPSSVLDANLKNRGYLALLQEGLRRHALALYSFAGRLGLTTYPEERGDGSYRLWLFFEKYTHFLKAKRFVGELIRHSSQPEGNIVVEPVLATTPVGLGWIESAVVLPLGMERSTQRRSFFIDEKGRPLEDQLGFMTKIRRIPQEKAAETSRILRGGEPLPPVGKKCLPPSVQLLNRRCPVIRQLVQMALAGRLLGREEKVVLYYTVGLADHSGSALHDILSACPDYDYESVKRQHTRLKSNPVSCPRIRQMIPEITVSVTCGCTFDLRGGKYPSPLLHLNPDLVPAGEAFLPQETVPLKEAAQRYLRLRQNQTEIERALLRYESLLEKQFMKKGIDKMLVEKSIIRRVMENGRFVWHVERV